jgi:hypothetical protein
LRGERCAALEQIVPRHAGVAVAQPRRGWLAWSKFGEIDGAGARAQSTDNKTRS